MGLGDMAKKAKDAVTSDEEVTDQSSGSTNPGPATGGVNAVGTTGGSDQGSGNTTARATSPGPTEEDASGAGRHRADEDEGGSQNPGPSDPPD